MKCKENLRSLKSLREHEKYFHLFPNTKVIHPIVTDPVFHRGDSALFYEKINSFMKSLSHSVPASFTQLYERIKKDGSRVNNFIQYEHEMSEFKIKYYKIVNQMHGQGFSPEMTSRINTACLSICKPVFDKYYKLRNHKTGNYYNMAVNLLKSLYDYLQDFVNDDVSYLIESTELDYRPGYRVGICYNVQFEFNPRDMIGRMELIRVVVQCYEKVCISLFEGIGDDCVKFNFIQGRESTMLYLNVWITIGPKEWLTYVLPPRSTDQIRIIGFSF